MKKKILGSVLGWCLVLPLMAQPESLKSYRDFPLVITLQFHSLSLPFRDLRSNFSNIGIGLGTELSFNGKHNWVQQLSMVWYRNKAVGNGLLLYTQAAWRLTTDSGVYSEIKGGVGYLLSFRPGDSFKQVNGDWISAGRKGKGMLAIPVGIGVGYDQYSSRAYVSPFVTYQFLLLSGYSKSVPLIPETLVQVGTRIHL